MSRAEKVKIMFVVLVTFLTSAYSFALAESNFPARYIDVVSTSSAGGGQDISFSPFRDVVPKVLGQPLVVDYKTGAAGAIAATFVARSKPDGYTLLFAGKGTLVSQPLTKKGIGYTLNDFTPICVLTKDPAIYYVRYDSPYKTFSDFIKAAKTKKMTYATHGTYSLPHISMYYIGKSQGFQATHIPYGGSSECITAALGGHVDMAIGTSAGSMVGPGRLRAIAVSSDRRWELYPDVPTLTELGFPIFKGGVISSAYWLWAPKGTPKEIVDKIYGAFKKAIDEKGEEITKILNNSEHMLAFAGPGEVWELAQHELELNKKLLEEMGGLGK